MYRQTLTLQTYIGLLQFCYNHRVVTVASLLCLMFVLLIHWFYCPQWEHTFNGYNTILLKHGRNTWLPGLNQCIVLVEIPQQHVMALLCSYHRCGYVTLVSDRTEPAVWPKPGQCNSGPSSQGIHYTCTISQTFFHVNIMAHVLITICNVWMYWNIRYSNMHEIVEVFNQSILPPPRKI